MHAQNSNSDGEAAIHLEEPSNERRTTGLLSDQIRASDLYSKSNWGDWKGFKSADDRKDDRHSRTETLMDRDARSPGFRRDRSLALGGAMQRRNPAKIS